MKPLLIAAALVILLFTAWVLAQPSGDPLIEGFRLVEAAFERVRGARSFVRATVVRVLVLVPWVCSSLVVPGLGHVGLLRDAGVWDLIAGWLGAGLPSPTGALS